MPTRKRKKMSRLRGSHTHGWGAKKKHRGKGSRGGSGLSGRGKRTNPKEPSIWKDPRYFGKYGFVNKNVKLEINALNIKQLDEQADELVENKLAKKEKDTYIINLEDLGFNKLLGSGRVNKKLKIKTRYASKKALEAVKKSGGEIILVKKEKESKQEKSKEKNNKIGG